MFSNLLNAIMIILSTSSLDKDIFDIHFAVITGITLLFSIVREEIISFVILVFGVLYSLTFTSLGITFIPTIALIFLIKRKNTNKIITTVLYFALISIFHNTITPLITVAYILWNYRNEINSKNRKLLLALLIIVLLLPFPEFTLRIRQITHQTQKSTINYTENYDYQTQQQTGKTNTTTKTTNPAESTNSQKKEGPNIQDILLRINQALIITFLVIGLITYIVNLRTLDKVDRKQFFKSFAITLITVSIILSLGVPKISSMFVKYNEKYIKQLEETRKKENPDNHNPSQENEQKPKQTLRPNPLSNPLGSKVYLKRDIVNKVSTIFQLISVVCSVLAILFMINELRKLLMKKIQNSEEKKKIFVEPTQFTTDYTYDEILKLDKEEFIEHAYLYIRKTFYPEYDYLTPYELLEIDNTEELIILTDRYVRLKYALEKIDYSDLSNLKAKFTKLCKNLQSQQETTHYNPLRNDLRIREN